MENKPSFFNEKTKEYTKKKDKLIRIRIIGSIFILAGIIYLLINLFFSFDTYKSENNGDQRAGFVSLSYFGVQRTNEMNGLINSDLLREHLSELKKLGFVTIDQSQLINFYNGEPLSKGALYLIFEDGRRDTAIFAQSILEDLNYKATMMSYVDKFDNHDTKFLMPDELQDMEKSSYWENGTNGFRLEYINAFDRYGNYLGEIDPLKHSAMQSSLGRMYNHYLMDYIRDKNFMPLESYNHMRSRLIYDYDNLSRIYKERLGYVPKIYTVMHANTGKFGNNPQVSEINEMIIKKLFAANFLREGYSFNVPDSSIYDLTRMQVQAWWPVNHLLMRLKYDIPADYGINIDFKTHDTETELDKFNHFTLNKGALQVKNETLYLTAEPNSEGIVTLNDSLSKNISVHTNLKGNAFGGQEILLRSDDERKNYISVELINGLLLVQQVKDGNKQILYRERIKIINGEPLISIDEDRKNVEVNELEVFARYADSPEKMKEYLARAEKRKAEYAPTIEDGAEEYIATGELNARQNHHIDIYLKDDVLQLVFDKHVLEPIKVENTDNNKLVLQADWNNEDALTTDNENWKKIFSKRNLAEDVYDAVFEEFTVSNLVDIPDDLNDDKSEVLFTSKMQGWEKVKYDIQNIWLKIIGWFVNNL